MYQTKNPELYYAYIYSTIQYRIEAYGRATATKLKQVQIQQNKSLKILFDKDYYPPTKELHRDLSLLQAQETFKLYCLKFVYKQQHFLLPDIFDTYFTNNNNVHQHNQRQKHGLHVRQPINKYGRILLNI